ncbi:MAG: SEL1-like repeat protein [Firmicutes bacterium]|nr:SEL1-like repeat protein [Bacillota bacterium]
MISNDLKKRAEAGDLDSQYQLSLRYYKGTGEDRDPRQGLLWMKVAAESGSLKAQKALGLLYASAQYAPYPDENPPEAVRMYTMAAEQGDAEAQYWLGTCYMTGYGVQASEEDGKRWISAARSNGYEVAPEDLPVFADNKKEEGGNRYEWEFSKENSGSGSAAESRPEPKPVEYGTLEPDTDDKKRSPAIGEAEPMTRIPRFSKDYLKTGVIFGLVGIVAGIVAALLVMLFQILFAGGPEHTILWFLILGIIGFAAGFYYGYRLGYQRAGDKAYFRSSPFYYQIHKDYEDLSRIGTNLYEIYARLQREFTPFSYLSPQLARSPFGSTRGYMIPSMILPGRKGMECIDLLLVSEKGIYVMNASGVTGTVSGSGEDEEWRTQSVTGRVRFFANQIFNNETAIQALQDALRALCPGFWLHDIPIYSVVIFGPHTNVEKLTHIPRWENKFVIAGTGENVRSFVEMQESRHSLRTKEMTEVMKAVEHLLRDYPENRHQAGTTVRRRY